MSRQVTSGFTHGQFSVSGFSCEEKNKMADGAQLTAAAATGDEKVLYL